MRACAAPRDGQAGTWIHEDMIAAYSILHRMGHAHSVETWRDGELVGGLYGVAIGRMFYGESMFSRRSDASKVALAHLAAQLRPVELWHDRLSDEYAALASLGAREIPRAEFVHKLQELIHYPDIGPKWHFDNHEPVA